MVPIILKIITVLLIINGVFLNNFPAPPPICTTSDTIARKGKRKKTAK
jgi:hypothetical protein